jgi:hypothetical protein
MTLKPRRGRSSEVDYCGRSHVKIAQFLYPRVNTSPRFQAAFETSSYPISFRVHAYPKSN